MAISPKFKNHSSARTESHKGGTGRAEDHRGDVGPAELDSASQRSRIFRFNVSSICQIALLISISSWVSFSAPAQAFQQTVESADELAESSTWKPATPKQIVDQFERWLNETQLNQATANDVTDYLEKRLSTGASAKVSPGELLDDIIDAIVIARPDVNKIREALRLQRTKTRPPEFSNLLDNPEEKTFLRDHVRLYYGRWLAQNEFYDEALDQLQQLDVDTILDRPSLLFYRGLMEHQLLKKEQCLETISKLLEQSDRLPRRYEVLSKLMLADIKPLEPDSLDEISRLMNDIRRRTDLSRSGKTVIKREVEVIEKLDKLIEDLESQQKSQMASSSVAPSTPMEDSRRAGGKGTGKVTSKQQNDGGQWGDLPPADRAAALAEMAKDMPPHYREVIEEYFKRLAKESK